MSFRITELGAPLLEHPKGIGGFAFDIRIKKTC
jgi:hypothetical protein